jgi:hypothetical protein
MPLVAVLIAALAGAGVSAIERAARPLSAVLALAAGSILLFLAAGAAPLVVALVPVPTTVRAEAASGLASAAVHGATVAALGAALLAPLAFSSRPILRNVSLALLAGAIAGDLLVTARGDAVVPTCPRRWLDEPPAAARAILERARGHDPGRVLSGPRAHELAEEDLPERVSPRMAAVLAHREALLAGHAGLHGLEEAYVYGPFLPRRLEALLRVGRAHLDHLADLAAIRTIVLPRGSDFAAGWGREAVAGAPGLELAFAPQATRARLVDRARPAASLAEAERELDAPDFDPRHDAVVEGLPGARYDTSGVTEYAVVRARSSERVEVEIEPRARAERLVVLSELWTEGGWRAFADGAPVACHAADAALVGVVVPAGTRTVAIVARTPGLETGAAISSAALVALVVALAVRRRTAPGQAPASASPAR